jgi:arylformamidase
MNAMKIYDVSVPISPEMPVYPGDPGVTVEIRQSIAKGDPCNLTYYCFGSHTGTHIDAPYHFVEGGQKVDDIPINLLMGRTLVVEFTAARIDAELLKEVDLGEHVRSYSRLATPIYGAATVLLKITFMLPRTPPRYWSRAASNLSG